MAAPSTELNTSTTSNITFAASPEQKKSEDTAALLQLELIEQIKVYNEQKKHKSKMVEKPSGHKEAQNKPRSVRFACILRRGSWIWSSAALMAGHVSACKRRMTIFLQL